MESIGTTLSNLIKEQFPVQYQDNGPLMVAFLEEYFRWLEQQSLTRDKFFPFTVNVRNGSANIVGFQTYFTLLHAGDQIAIVSDPQTEDYEIFTVESIANNSFLTLTSDKIPKFTLSGTKYTTVSLKPNAVFFTRNFFDINDIDETFDEYVIYFKEKYLKKLQFKTITNTRSLVKHSLDLYRSKGTERSIDLLYKAVFGKPANVYYPKDDMFKTSSGVWYIPRYLELSIGNNKRLINKEITGAGSGATAFVEEIIRRNSNDRIVEVAYISDIRGNFITGEKITLNDNSLDMEEAPIIVGSLNEVLVDVNGTGLNFAQNQIVTLSSQNGRGAIGKVLTTANTAGEIFFSLADGGYGFSNTISVANTRGTVSVNSACSTVTGTTTTFIQDYHVGDSISVWQSPDAYETHKVISVSSNTILSVDSNFQFTNASAVAAFTRTFGNTYISEKILHISNVQISAAYNNFEYVPFLGGITQPLAQLNYLNSNGIFNVGDILHTYNLNNSANGTARVLDIIVETQTAGTLLVAPLTGSVNLDTIYSDSNTIGANLSVINGYIDLSATANCIGNYANVTVTCNGVNGVFSIGETLVQPASGAQGIINSSVARGANVVLGISDSIGIFKSGFEVDDVNFVVSGNTSLSTARVISAEIDVGVINVNNGFEVFEGNWIETDFLTGIVTNISKGLGANVIFAEDLLYPEDIFFPTDFIRNFLTYNLAQKLHVTVNTDTPNVFVLISGNTANLAQNYRIANSSSLSIVNTQVQSRITTIVNSTAFSTNTVSTVVTNGTANVIARVIWPFYANNVVDLEFPVNSAFTSTKLTVGKLDRVLSTSPGENYNQLPIIRFHDSTIFSYNIPDTVTLNLINSGGYAVGEIIEQASSNARGMVKKILSGTAMSVQVMRFLPNNAFVVTTNVASQIVGDSTGVSGNVTSVVAQLESPRLGSDVTLNSRLVVGEGAVTSIQILDSGFGFVDGEFVWIGSEDGLNFANGFAVDTTHGTGSGYYKSQDGFLSDVKKLQDSWYYQDYSYEVRSGVANTFKNVLKDIVHVAGTKYFDALVYESINMADTAFQTSIQQTIGELVELNYQSNTLIWGDFTLEWNER